MIRFPHYFSLGCILLLLFFSVPLTQAKELPTTCSEGRGYTAQQILQTLQSLEEKVNEYDDLTDQQIKTNYKNRAYIQLRTHIAVKNTFWSFSVQKKTSCFRKDIRSIEEEIAAIQSLLLKKNVWEKGNEAMLTAFLQQLALMQDEFSRLERCGALDPDIYDEEVNLYFSEEYMQGQCTPDKKNWSVIAASYKELMEKLRSLDDAEGWGNVFSSQSWKSITTKEGRSALRDQAENQAAAWVSDHSIPAIFGVEQFFSSEPESRDEEQEERVKSKEENDDDKDAQTKQITQYTDSLYRAFSTFEAVEENFDMLVAYEKADADALEWASRDYTAGEIFREQIADAVTEVRNQKEYLSTLKKTLQRFVNKQAQNL